MQSTIRGVLIDVSGTIHVADQAIPGAVKALDRLRASGIPVTLLATRLFFRRTEEICHNSLLTSLRRVASAFVVVA
jgi:ribonucleotide monophosphatase NagD (HAD superfamily)